VATGYDSTICFTRVKIDPTFYVFYPVLFGMMIWVPHKWKKRVKIYLMNYVVMNTSGHTTPFHSNNGPKLVRRYNDYAVTTAMSSLDVSGS
jgi:hypothetical protein